MAVGAAIAAINRVVDPKNEFYSGAPLTEALESNCLLADDVVRSRSYPEFKRDLFGRRNEQDGRLRLERGDAARRQPRLPRLRTGDAARRDAGPRSARRRGQTAERLRRDERLLVRPRRGRRRLRHVARRRRRATCSARGRSRRASTSCAARARSPSPAGRRNALEEPASSTAARRPRPGARTARSPGRQPQGASTVPASFAWNRLTSVDQALAIARARRWRVVGLSGLTPRWETYEHELRALFAKHGYRWRIRRMQA